MGSLFCSLSLSLFLSLVKGDNCAWTSICSQCQDAGLSPATLETGEDQFCTAGLYSLLLLF